MAYTILSDFDGVWTNQAREAEALFELFVRRVARVAGERPERVDGVLRAFVDRLSADPTAHGWAPDGRISAFIDEDPLLRTSAMTAALRTDTSLARYRDAIVREFEDLGSFADACFVDATAAFSATGAAVMVPGAAEAMDALLGAGVTVVVVSNSSSDKVVSWLCRAGIDAGSGGAAVQVVGDAKKWSLGPTDAHIDAGGRRVYVDRPHYRRILEEVQPDLVIGDVFSLDLALPAVMRDAGNGPRQLVLRGQPHTPAWCRDDHAGGLIDVVVTHPRDLVTII